MSSTLHIRAGDSPAEPEPFPNRPVSLDAVTAVARDRQLGAANVSIAGPCRHAASEATVEKVAARSTDIGTHAALSSQEG
jgi:hypothetical protein